MKAIMLQVKWKNKEQYNDPYVMGTNTSQIWWQSLHQVSTIINNNSFEKNAVFGQPAFLITGRVQSSSSKS